MTALSDPENVGFVWDNLDLSGVEDEEEFEDEDDVESMDEDGFDADTLATLLAATSAQHTGAMVALMPSEEHAARLAVDGGEYSDQLHMTLQYLGKGADLNDDEFNSLVDGLVSYAESQDGPLTAKGFAISTFNPNDAEREMCYVLGVSGESLSSIFTDTTEVVNSTMLSGVPEQHSPWAPHVTLAYSDDASLGAKLFDRTGDITFDRIRVARGDSVIDIPLGHTTSEDYNATGGEEMTDNAVFTSDVPGTWRGILIVEDVESGDGRMFSPNSLQFSEMPLPLMWQKETSSGHDGSVTAGRIDKVWREGPNIWGSGVFDLASEDGAEAHRLVGEKFLRGVSGDVDSVKESDVEFVFPPSDGEDEMSDMFAAPEMTIFHAGRLRGATLVQFPAFVEASIHLAQMSSGVAASASSTPTLSIVHADEPCDHQDNLTACGCVDTAPPREWFKDPQLTEPTPMTITSDGRIFGHGALWGTCHTGFSGQCVTPPREGAHDHYTLGETLCADGTTVATGVITMGTGHAPTGGKLTAAQAVEHYDSTGTQVADVVTGEDDHGIWFAGAIRDGLSPMRLRALRASKLSGDWRRRGNALRLIALLAVNVPGFPVPRTRTSTTQGRQVALVAAGLNHATVSQLQEDHDQAAMRTVVQSMSRRIGRDEATRLAELKTRIHGS